MSHELRYRNRHRRSAGIVRVSRVQESGDPYVVQDNNRRLPGWRPLHPQRPIHFESPVESFNPNTSSVIRLQTYEWGMSISECSDTCNGGQQTVTVFCHAGNYIADFTFCDAARQPARNGTRSCNNHLCLGR